MVIAFEVTTRVIQERREKCLQKLSARAGSVPTVIETCQAAAECFGDDPGDIPFSLIYLFEGDGQKKQAVLQATSGITIPHPSAPPKCSLSDESNSPWPITGVFQKCKSFEINDLRNQSLPGGLWPDNPTEAVALPITGCHGEVVGVVILGVSPRLEIDDVYRSFHLLISRQLSNNVSIARSHEEERQKWEALAKLGGSA